MAGNWVQASTHPYSDTGVSGYGFMWWVESGGKLYAPDMKFPSGSFMGVGLGGQYLVIVPACQLVVVNRVDTGESKFEQLREFIADPRFADEKLIVFTEHKDTLDFLIRRLGGMGFTGQIAQIHGGMHFTEREEQVEHFRRDATDGGASPKVPVRHQG